MAGLYFPTQGLKIRDQNFMHFSVPGKTFKLTYGKGMHQKDYFVVINKDEAPGERKDGKLTYFVINEGWDNNPSVFGDASLKGFAVGLGKLVKKAWNYVKYAYNYRHKNSNFQTPYQEKLAESAPKIKEAFEKLLKGEPEKTKTQENQAYKDLLNYKG